MIKIFHFHKLLYNSIIFEIKLYGGIGFSLARSRTTGRKSERTSGERSGTSVTQATQEQENRQTGTTRKTGEQESVQKGTTVSRGKARNETGQELTSVLSNLDEATQTNVKELIDAIGSPEQLNAIISALGGRALNADNALAGKTNAIVSEARASGGREIGKAQTRLAKGAGSTQNSLVQQIGLEAQVDLESKLGALTSSLEVQNRQIATGELQGAAQIQGQGVTSLVNALKGATQVTEQQQTTTQLSETEQVQQALQELFQTSSTTELQDLLATITGKTTREQEINEAFAKRGAGDSSAVNQSGGIAGNMGFG